MSALRQLKSYTPHCTFLHRASLRSLSTISLAAKNSLSSRATLCPLLSTLQSSNALHTSAIVESGLGNDSAKGGQQTQIRQYASISPQDPTLLHQSPIAQETNSINPTTNQSKLKDEGKIIGHRPTNALGFAERIAERGGGFQFEKFYQGEIDKKLKDKSTCFPFFVMISRREEG